MVLASESLFLRFCPKCSTYLCDDVAARQQWEQTTHSAGTWYHSLWEMDRNLHLFNLKACTSWHLIVWCTRKELSAFLCRFGNAVLHLCHVTISRTQRTIPIKTIYIHKVTEICGINVLFWYQIGPSGLCLSKEVFGSVFCSKTNFY